MCGGFFGDGVVLGIFEWIVLCVYFWVVVCGGGDGGYFFVVVEVLDYILVYEEY